MLRISGYNLFSSSYMIVVLMIYECFILLCLFYSDVEKICFVIFEILFKCLNKVLCVFN